MTILEQRGRSAAPLAREAEAEEGRQDTRTPTKCRSLEREFCNVHPKLNFSNTPSTGCDRHPGINTASQPGPRNPAHIAVQELTLIPSDPCLHLDVNFFRQIMKGGLRSKSDHLSKETELT